MHCTPMPYVWRELSQIKFSSSLFCSKRNSFQYLSPGAQNRECSRRHLFVSGVGLGASCDEDHMGYLVLFSLRDNKKGIYKCSQLHLRLRLS